MLPKHRKPAMRARIRCCQYFTKRINVWSRRLCNAFFGTRGIAITLLQIVVTCNKQLNMYSYFTNSINFNLTFASGSKVI
ncbi:hypothetical protein HanRHA438_Chr13g0614411 [Helianthus annuus]|nr:hypothetical protein HanRHA438_Chr13g0614411 [Helianthus annuus]